MTFYRSFHSVLRYFFTNIVKNISIFKFSAIETLNLGVLFYLFLQKTT